MKEEIFYCDFCKKKLVTDELQNIHYELSVKYTVSINVENTVDTCKKCNLKIKKFLKELKKC